MDFQLGLRQGRYRVSLIGINSHYEPPIQFALCFPNSRNPYADIITSWGGNPESPRENQDNAINVPLDRRTQTFLSHQVSPELAQQLRGFTPRSNLGREGSTYHQIEINTHRSNQLTVRERAHHVMKYTGNDRLQMRESIVTHMKGEDHSSQRANTISRMLK